MVSTECGAWECPADLRHTFHKAVELSPPTAYRVKPTFIQWLGASDVNPSNWDDYDNYCKGEQRWMAIHMCYDIAATLSPMAIFAMSV